MDLLASQGEISPADMAELSAMSKDDLIALVSGMNRGWYQLLARLEDAHRQDLSQLEKRLTDTYQEEVAQLEDDLTSHLDGVLRSIKLSGPPVESGSDYVTAQIIRSGNGEEIASAEIMSDSPVQLQIPSSTPAGAYLLEATRGVLLHIADDGDGFRRAWSVLAKAEPKPITLVP